MPTPTMRRTQTESTAASSPHNPITALSSVPYGKTLVAKKVKCWVAMACKYPAGKEYNSRWDAESSRIALENWPTPIIFTDFEYGKDCFAGRAIAEMEGPRNPVKDVFKGNLPSREEIRRDPARQLRRCFGMGGRAAWDETAVLIAVRGTERYFNVERGTYRMVGDDGSNEWAPDAENGPHLRVTEKLSKAEVARIIDGLMMRCTSDGRTNGNGGAGTGNVEAKGHSRTSNTWSVTNASGNAGR